jgi:phosphopantetheinyl transferase (holo-ACP synthase)
LKGGIALEDTPPPPTNAALPQSAGAGLNGAPDGIGIEIETLANLPDAANYGEHDFYLDAFAPSEIAYCLRQPAIKASFCGLLAAKKAILKSGAAKGPLEDLRRIEIVHDADGRPTYPGALESSSHADAAAAAVSLYSSGQSPLPVGAAGSDRGPNAGPSNPLNRGTQIFVIAVLLSLVFLFAFGLWKILQFASMR